MVPDEWNEALISVTDENYIFRFPVAENLLNGMPMAELTNGLVIWSVGEPDSEIPLDDTLGFLMFLPKERVSAFLSR